MSDTKRDWDNVIGGSTDPVCYLLQLHEAPNSSQEGQTPSGFLPLSLTGPRSRYYSFQSQMTFLSLPHLLYNFLPSFSALFPSFLFIVDEALLHHDEWAKPNPSSPQAQNYDPSSALIPPH